MPKCSQCIVSPHYCQTGVVFVSESPPPDYLTNISGKFHEKGELGTWIYSYVCLTNVACGSVFIYLAF